MDCVICWDEFQDTAYSLSCGHLFHKECIEGLRRGRSGVVLCPMCRQTVSTDVSPTHMRQIFLASPRHNANTATVTDGDTEQLKKDLDDALLNKGIAERKLARSQAENALFIRQNAELTTIHDTQKREVDRLRESELQMRHARDDAANRARRLTSDRDALAAKIAALEEQKTEMQRRIDKQWEFIEQTMESFKRLQQNRSSTTTAQPESAPQPTATVSPFTGTRANSGEATSIFATSRQARTRNQQQPRRIQPVPAEVESPAAPPAPRVRALKTGKDILAKKKKYQKEARVPQYTAVLECVASDGEHDFCGTGSNQFVKIYRCLVPGCGECVKEYTRRSPYYDGPN